MKKYPKFMKALPEFFGLGFLDLGYLVLGLNLGLILALEPFTTIGLVALLIGTSRIVRKKMDFIGLLVKRERCLELNLDENGDMK